jgi:hypothetical protein
VTAQQQHDSLAAAISDSHQAMAQQVMHLPEHGKHHAAAMVVEVPMVALQWLTWAAHQHYLATYGPDPISNGQTGLAGPRDPNQKGKQ